MQAEFSNALLDTGARYPGDLRIREGANAERRFGIYRNNVLVALIDGLADAYPVVGALVGESFFRAMSREFCTRNPPRSPVMAEYGDEFPEFIRSFGPAASLPYLGDLARLEWQRVVALHSNDEIPLENADVFHLVNDPEALMQTRWLLHSSVAVVQSPHAIVSLWAAHQLTSVDDVVHALAGIDLQRPESALIVRHGLEVMMLNLTSAETAFISSLGDGNSLADSAMKAQKLSLNFDLTLAFILLIRSGALVGFSYA